MLDDLVEEVFAKANLAVKEHRRIGLAFVPPKLASVGDGRGNELLTMLVLVDQPDMSVEEPSQLVAEPRRAPVAPPPTGSIPTVRMNSESDFPRISSRLWVCTASVQTQASNRRGKLPKGACYRL